MADAEAPSTSLEVNETDLKKPREEEAAEEPPAKRQNVGEPESTLVGPTGKERQKGTCLHQKQPVGLHGPPKRQMGIKSDIKEHPERDGGLYTDPCECRSEWCIQCIDQRILLRLRQRGSDGRGRLM